MAITGGIKFFDKNLCLFKDGSNIDATTSTDSANYAIDLNPDTRWRSNASTDLITETLTVTFDEAKEISRLFLLDFNFKDFTVKYNVLGTWTHFASVTGLSGAKTNITETAFAYDSAYYEFTPVTTDSIQIAVTKSQVVDAQKYLTQFIVTNELGTLAGYPEVKRVKMDKNARISKTISGKNIVQKSIETADFDLNFKGYPSAAAYNADMDLMMTLHDRQNPFLVWLCGGRRGSSYFRYTLRGFRLKDVFQMQVMKAVDLGYTDNIYNGSLNAKVVLDEHV